VTWSPIKNWAALALERPPKGDPSQLFSTDLFGFQKCFWAGADPAWPLSPTKNSPATGGLVVSEKAQGFLQIMTQME